MLNTLAARGVVRRIQPAGSVARYELRTGDNHHHVVCRGCGDGHRRRLRGRRGAVPRPARDRRRARLLDRRGRGDLVGRLPRLPGLGRTSRPEPPTTRSDAMPDLPQPNDGTSIATAPSEEAQLGSTTDTGAPAPQRPQHADGRPRRPDPAARRALPEPDGALQPRARPGAQRARQGLGRVRRVRDHRGRLGVHQGGAVPARREDRDARPLLDRRRRAGLPRHLARPARLRAEVLHDRGQLRPRRQQHPGLLHPRHDEVPALHPLAEAPRRLRPARQQHAVGLLDASTPSRRTRSPT